MYCWLIEIHNLYKIRNVLTLMYENNTKIPLTEKVKTISNCHVVFGGTIFPANRWYSHGYQLQIYFMLRRVHPDFTIIIINTLHLSSI